MQLRPLKSLSLKDSCNYLAQASMLYLGALTLPAYADSSDDTASQRNTVDEIIVSARLREESLQSAGIAVTALTGDSIDELGIFDVSDIVRRVPGLDLFSRGPNKSDLIIRGLGNLVVQSDFQRTTNLTGVFIDDVSAAATFNAQRGWNLYDLERIEIVRGPQGTLYGEGSMGGAIRYVTRDPDLNNFGLRLHSTVSDTYGADDLNWLFNGTVNIPIVEDKLGLRITGFYRDDAGFIDYTAIGQDDANGFESNGVRGVVLAELTENLTARVSVTYENSEMKSAWLATTPVDDLENAFHPGLQPQLDKAIHVSGTLEYDLGFGTITSVTGYFNRDVDDLGVDEAISGPLGILTNKEFLLDNESISQEVRFTSNFDGPFNFILGAYYKDTEQVVDLDETVPPFGGGTVLVIDEFYNGRQFSIFGEGTYSLTDCLDVSVGVRYFNEKIDSNQAWTSPDLFFGFVPDRSFASQITIEKFLPKLLVEYQVTEDALLYAGASSGARNGGLNVTSTLSFIALVADDTPFRVFEEDSTWSYEIGAKTSWFNSQLIANIAAYYVDWRDPQLIVNSPPLLPFFPAGIGLVDNADKARSIGVEIETNYRPNEYLDFFFSGNYTNAIIKGEVSVNPVLGLIIPDGSPIPGVPKWTINTGLNVSYPIKPIMDRDANVVARINYQRTASQNSRLTLGMPGLAMPDEVTPEFGTLNLRFGLEVEDFKLTFFGKNVLNAIQPLYVAPGTGGFFIGEPRVLGISLDKSF